MDRTAAPRTNDFELLHEARALWSSGQRDAAIERFELAVRAEPDNVRALLESARTLGQVYQIARAETLLDRATTLAGSDPNVAPQIAQSYRLIHRPFRAIVEFQKLQHANQLPAPLLAELAVLYEQTNQLEQARAAIEECVAQAPGQLEPKLILARIQRERGAPDAAKAELDDLQRIADGSPLLRVRILTELCHLCDAAADYDGAVFAIEEAKQFLRGTKRASQLLQRRRAVNIALCQITNDFNRTVRDEWRDARSPTDSRGGGIAHLIGFPRSGTTLLEQILAAHPNLVTSSERPVFARDIFPEMHRAGGKQPLTLASLQAISDQQLMQQRTRYLNAMEAILGEPLDGRVHLDKNPNHTSLVVGLLRLFPESRFLFAVRDPRDVIVSTYLRFFPLTEFSVAFLDWNTLCDQYTFDMNLWFSIRELLSDQSLQFRYEDLVQDWQTESKSALQFLGLDWHEAVADYRTQLQRKVINSPSQAAVRNSISDKAVGRWKNYERYLGPYLQKLDLYCREFGYC